MRLKKNSRRKSNLSPESWTDHRKAGVFLIEANALLHRDCIAEGCVIATVGAVDYR